MPLVSNKDIETLIKMYLRDKPVLQKLDRYHQGNHDKPFIPRHASEEYKLITSRCYTNFIRQAVVIPTQAMYVDGFRATSGSVEANSPAAVSDSAYWETWQRSRLDMLQTAVHSGAFVFGYALTVAALDRTTGKSRIRGLSALRSSALFDDPANDIVPRAAIEFLSEPHESFDEGQQTVIPGKARVWGPTHEEMIEWRNTSNKQSFTRVGSPVAHGATECPVTRFPASLDLEGRCVGIVEPLVDLQNRINQSIHDLLIAQVYTSFQVRTATGMSGVVQQRQIFETDLDGNVVFDEDGHPVVQSTQDVLDENGQPVLVQANINAASMLISEDPDTKFGVLPGAPLDGFIKAIDMGVKQFATLSQTPPHYMMGSITNIAADALQAAEIALKRKIDLFKVYFGECWERTMNVAAEIDGIVTPDEKMETLWRDTEGQSFARMADALLKLKELNVPAQGLWTRIPGVQASELKQWKEMIEEDPDQILAAAVAKGTAQTTRPDGQQPTDPNREQTNADAELE